MKRYRFILLFMAILFFLLGAGCLQEQDTGNVSRPPLVVHQEAMQQHLHNVTGGTQSALDGLNAAVADAAVTLGKTGISGPEADSVLSGLATYHSAIMNVITYDPDGTVLAAEPASAQELIGQNLYKYDIVRTSITIKEPAMSDLFTLAEGGDGSVITYPVFSADGNFTGVLSVAFSPYALIAPVSEEAMGRAPYTYTVAQTDGRLIYHPDPELVGKLTFNETVFTDFPEILELARQYSTNRSGYATFPFYSIRSGEIVRKETWWDTVGLHGTEWRVLVIGER